MKMKAEWYIKFNRVNYNRVTSIVVQRDKILPMSLFHQFKENGFALKHPGIDSCLYIGDMDDLRKFDFESDRNSKLALSALSEIRKYKLGKILC